MARIQNLADKAFRGETDESKQEVSVSAFCNGLVDQDAARLVAVQAKGSVTRALNIAASVGAYSKHPMKARKYKADKNTYNYNLLANETSQALANENNFEETFYAEGEENSNDFENEDEEIMCAAPTFRGRRGGYRGTSRGWRGRGGPGRGGAPARLLTNAEGQPITCFRCGGKGHTAVSCSSPGYFRDGAINPNVTCLNCGELGHIKSQCTNPAQARETALPAQPQNNLNLSTTISRASRANTNPNKSTGATAKPQNLAASALDEEVEPNLILVDDTVHLPPEQVDDIIVSDDLLCIGADENPKRSLFWMTVNV